MGPTCVAAIDCSVAGTCDADYYHYVLLLLLVELSLLVVVVVVVAAAAAAAAAVVVVVVVVVVAAAAALVVVLFYWRDRAELRDLLPQKLHLLNHNIIQDMLMYYTLIL